MRMARHVYNLRSRRSFSVVARALAKAAERFGMRIVEFAIEGNHLHLVVEAETSAALSRGMQGFSIRVAKGLNRMMKRAGRVLGDRFHAHLLRTPTETRRALAYVRGNHRKHMAQIGQPLPPTYVDAFSSASGAVALPAPHTWLLGARASPRARQRQ